MNKLIPIYLAQRRLQSMTRNVQNLEFLAFPPQEEINEPLCRLTSSFVEWRHISLPRGNFFFLIKCGGRWRQYKLTGLNHWLLRKPWPVLIFSLLSHSVLLGSTCLTSGSPLNHGQLLLLTSPCGAQEIILLCLAFPLTHTSRPHNSSPLRFARPANAWLQVTFP